MNTGYHAKSPDCHPERSEESHLSSLPKVKILRRYAPQNDRESVYEMESKNHGTIPRSILHTLLLFVGIFCLFCGTDRLMLAAGRSHDSTSTQSWFSVTQVADQVWRIDDHGGDNMYLIAGKDTALLIDAGNGVADLLACVKSITSLPLVVVNTHGHPDHCGSDYQFAEVYAHPSDFEKIKSFCNETFHEGAVERAEKQSPGLAPLLMKEIPDFTMPTLVPVREGFVFKLGERNLEVIETPGHTKGSICLLDTANKLLFAGDDNNTLVWLFLNDCLPLEVYARTLEDLKQRSGRFTTILPGHGDPLDAGFIDEQIACARTILGGECKGDPYKTFVDSARVCTYKRARIAFDPDNLWMKRD
jgi:hydroxyacylglutathione hydrolase